MAHIGMGGVCADCGQPSDNHVCPLRVGTIPGALVTLASGKTVVQRIPSANPPCTNCGLVHHNEKGRELVCAWNATARARGFDPRDYANPDNWKAVADALITGAIAAPNFRKVNNSPQSPTVKAPKRKVSASTTGAPAVATPAPAVATPAPTMAPAVATPSSTMDPKAIKAAIKAAKAKASR